MAEKISGACDAAKRGWRVFPIKRGASAPPLIREWEDNASSDINQIFDWSIDFPDCNWGLACGSSELFVLDIDMKHGKNGRQELDLLELEYGEVPETYKVRTPSGGWHYYYLNVGASSVDKIGKGLDSRSKGGYVVLPGSETDKGTYVAELPSVICPCPEWLIAKAGHAIAREPREEIAKGVEWDQPLAITRAVKYLLTAEPSVEGQGGDNNTIRVALNVRDFGVSELRCLSLMHEFWNDRCLPPWEFDELERKVSNAYQYALLPAGNTSPDADFDDLPDLLDPTIPAIPFKRGSDIVAADIPKREWLLGDRYLKGYMTATIAPGGAGKSSLIMAELLSIASGKPLTGLSVYQQGKVWCYNTEDPLDELERKAAALAQHHGLDPSDMSNLLLSSGLEKPLILVSESRKGGLKVNDVIIESIIKIIKEENILVLALDPFVRLHRCDENNNMAIDLVAQCLTRISTATNCAISICHHTRKKSNSGSDAGNMESARGASALINACRIAHTVVGMTAKEALDNKINPDKAGFYFRLDSAKANLSAPQSTTTWFERKSVTIDNGDCVGAVTTFLFGQKLNDKHAKLLQDVCARYSAPIAAIDMAKILIADAEGYEGKKTVHLSRDIVDLLGKEGKVHSTFCFRVVLTPERKGKLWMIERDDYSERAFDV